MISFRINHTQDPPLIEIGKLAKSTTNCINLGQGVPYYQPPKTILLEYAEILENHKLHQYSPDQGIIELRTEISNKLIKENDIRSTSDQLVITPGANQAFMNVLLTICDPNDEVILLSPYYFNHLMACSIANVKAIPIPLNRDYSFPIGKIQQKITKLTKVIVIVNPGNPTGAVHQHDDLNKLGELLDNFDLWLISDETYEYFTYGDSKHKSLASITNISLKVITIGSFSKSYGIPGWRLGYYHSIDKLINASLKVQDTIGICAPSPSQALGLILLKHRKELIPKHYRLMEANYKIAKDLLEEIQYLEPENGKGAYYLFPHQTTGINTIKLAKQMITSAQVALVPGSAFGMEFQDYFRISFANVNEETLKTAFSRLKSFK